MSKYLELLAEIKTNPKGCGLGRVLRDEGQEKYDEILEAIFAVDEFGIPYSTAKLETIFKEEYGWSSFFYRRHRNGKCVSCLNRIPTN